MGGANHHTGGELCVSRTFKITMKEKILDFFWYTIKFLWLLFLFAGVPGIIYEIAINTSYEKGLSLIIIIYWVTVLTIAKYRAEIKSHEKDIKKLLYGTMGENEKTLLKKKLELEE